MNYKNHLMLLEKLLGQFEQKDAAYGYAAHKSFCEFGRISFIVRLYDKLNRYKTLVKHPEMPRADESIADTLADAATYCFMAIGSELVNQIMGCDNGALAHALTVAIMKDICIDPNNYLHNIVVPAKDFSTALNALEDSERFCDDCLWLGVGFLHEAVKRYEQHSA